MIIKKEGILSYDNNTIIDWKCNKGADLKYMTIISPAFFHIYSQKTAQF